MAALGLIGILSGCGTTDAQRRIETAAAEIGRQTAGRNLPEWPVYCREPMPAVTPKIGEKARWAQRRWEITRDNENKRVEWCAAHYDQIAKAQ